MATKKFIRGTNAIVYSALALGILVLINIISSQIFTRIDLTEEQIFTLSDGSRRLVRSLPDRLTAKAFISSDLPPVMKGRANYLRDLLSEYHTASEGKLAWEALDPARDEAIKQEAQRLKVHPVNLTVYEKTKASASQSYLGVAFQYAGKVEAIPFAVDEANLEYLISSTIRRLTSKRKKVGFTTGHGEASLYQDLASAQRALTEFETTTVDLTEGKNPIPDEVDVLVMVGPTQRLAERAQYELDRYLIKGKSLALFVDGMTLETPRGDLPQNQAPLRIARANPLGLERQLEYYGIKLNHDLVLDQQNQRVIVPTGQGRRVVTNYPAFPIVTDLSKENLITQKLKAFVAVFPSSLELTEAVRRGKNDIRGVVLARSSEGSWRQRDFFLFNPLQPPQPTKELGPFNLALSLQGRFKSFFAGRPIPAPGPARPPAENEPTPSGAGPRSPAGTRLVVVADSDLVKDQYLSLYPGNLLLLQNIVDYLAQDETLIAIRSKSQTRRPLREVSDSRVSWAKYGNVVLLPLAFVLLGVVRWRWRRVSRRRRAETLVKKP